MQLSKFAFVVSSCLVIRSAAAQPSPADGPSQSVLPGVLSTSAGTTIDGRMDFTDFGFGTGVALNLHGQHITSSGLGGYLSLPLAYAAAGEEDGSGLGNLQLGGLYAIRRGSLDAYARGGVALGASSTGEDMDDLMPMANLIPRPADALTTGLDTSFVRAGGGLRLTSGAVVVGASGGVDLPFDSDDAFSVLHLTSSIGIAQPRFGLAVGATMLLVNAEDAESLFGFQGVGDVAVGDRTRLYGAVGASFEADDPLFSVGAGLRVRL